MRIRVSREHIELGIRCDCGHCPLAVALREALPWLEGLHVRRFLNSWDAAWWHGSDIAFVLLPEDAARRAERFDEEGEMDPFEFEIEIPARPLYLEDSECR